MWQSLVTWSGGWRNWEVLASSMKRRMPSLSIAPEHASSTSAEKREEWLSVPTQSGQCSGGRPAATSTFSRASICVRTDPSHSSIDFCVCTPLSVLDIRQYVLFWSRS